MSRGPLALPALDRLVDDGVLPGYSVAVRSADDVRLAVRGVADPASGTSVTEATSYRLGSLSKPVAGLLTAALAADGVFDLDADVTDWWPELAGLRVLREPGAALEGTVSLDRPMTVRQRLGVPHLDRRALRPPRARHRHTPRGVAAVPAHQSFGHHVSVTTADDPAGPRTGSVGWAGAVGTLGHVDPTADLAGVLLTNRMIDGPEGSPAFAAFVADLYAHG
ncbi:MAG: serine hydrolase [Dermatophilaceae bacterium]